MGLTTISSDTTTGLLKKRPGGASVLNLLDFAINGGCDKWAQNITYATNATIDQGFIFAKAFVVNAGVTLTLTPLMPLIIVAKAVTINGTITASGKGCPEATGKTADGYSCTLQDMPMFGYSSSSQGNGCLCGAGGGQGIYGGGGAWSAGVAAANGPDVALTDAELRSMLLSPVFKPFHIGLGGGGAGNGAGTYGYAGAGSILIISASATIASTASLLAIGAGGAAANSTGGGGGFVGVASGDLNVDSSATFTVTSGVGSLFDGGDGSIAKIEV